MKFYCICQNLLLGQKRFQNRWDFALDFKMWLFWKKILILKKGACFVHSKITPTTSNLNYSVSSALIALQSLGVLGSYS